jgi:hypothetical protein
VTEPYTETARRRALKTTLPAAGVAGHHLNRFACSGIRLRNRGDRRGESGKTQIASK